MWRELQPWLRLLPRPQAVRVVSLAKTRSPLVSTTWEMVCNVVALGYMRPRRGILRSDDILAKDRQGTANLFLFCEPQACWRHIEVTDRRTMVDCAQQLKWLVDERYPEADLIRLVGDQLNTHRIASLYEAFPPEEARRIARKLEFHHTPKH